MIEEMEIGILLSIAGDAPKALAALADQMTDLDAIAKGLTDTFGVLSGMLDGVAASAAQLGTEIYGFAGANNLANRSLARSAARVDAVTGSYSAMADAIKGVTDAQASMGAVAGLSIGPVRAAGATEAEAGGIAGWRAGIMQKGGGIWDAVGPALGLAIGGTVVDKLLGPAMAYQHALIQLQMAGDTPKDYRLASRTASAVAQTVPLTTYTEAVKQMNEARMIFGNTKMAAQMLPALSKMNAFMTAASGHDVDFTYSAAKALEEDNAWRSKTQFDKELNWMSKVYEATGGRINPNDFLMVYKYSHGLEMSWSDRFKYQELPTMMQEFKNKNGGTQTVGTMLTSLFSGLYAGSVQQRFMPQWIKYGLESSKNIVTTNSKMWRGFKPGTALGAALFQKNPLDWMYHVLVPDLEKHGVNMHKKSSIERMAWTLFGMNRNEAGILYTMIAQHDKVIRDRRLIREAHGNKYLEWMIKNDPTAQTKNAVIQFENALTQAGTAAIPLLDKELRFLTGVLKSFTSFIKHHQEAAKWLFVAMQALGVLIAGRLTAALIKWAVGPLVKFGVKLWGLAPKIVQLGAKVLEAYPALGRLALKAGGAAEAMVEVAAVGYAAYEATKWLLSITGVQKKLDNSGFLHYIDRNVYETLHPHSKLFDSSLGRSSLARINAPVAGMQAPQVHHHHVTVVIDGHEVTPAVAKWIHDGVNSAPTGPSQYAPYSTMPYPQNPAPTGG